MDPRDVRDVRKAFLAARKRKAPGTCAPRAGTCEAGVIRSQQKPRGEMSEGTRRHYTVGDPLTESVPPAESVSSSHSPRSVDRVSALAEFSSLLPPCSGRKDPFRAVAESSGQLIGHLGRYIELWGSSKEKILSLERKMSDANFYISESELRASEAEGDLLVKQKVIDEMHRDGLRKAIKMGEASLALAGMRKKKDEAFATAQAEIAEVKKKCHADIYELRADARRRRADLQQVIGSKDSHIRWLKERMASDRNKIAWLNEERCLAEEARGSAVAEAKSIRDFKDGESERLRTAYLWAQNRYSVEMTKNALLHARLDRADEVVRGLQQRLGIEVTGLQDEVPGPEVEESELYSD